MDKGKGSDRESEEERTSFSVLLWVFVCMEMVDTIYQIREYRKSFSKNFINWTCLLASISVRFQLILNIANIYI